MINLIERDKKNRLYRIWGGMRQRCNNEKNDYYHLYGGRGISVCDEWNDFINFYNWSILNGYDNNLSIDRVDSNGNYEPSNCRWATPSQQSRNRRTNKLIEIDGVTKTAIEWEKEYDLKKNIVSSRFNHGYRGRDLLRKEKIIKTGCKLDESKILEIVNLLNNGDLSKKEIAKIYGLSQTGLWKIDTGRTWSHITGRGK